MVACATLLLLHGAVDAAEKDSAGFAPQGWVPFSELDKALDFAREKRRSLVFLYISTEPSKEQRDLAESWAREQTLQGFIRVVVHPQNKSPVEQVRASVRDSSRQMPRLFFATPDLVISGFVAPREPKRLRKVAALALSIDRWLEEAREDLDKADRLAEQGRLGAALKLVGKAASEDQTYTYAVMQTWESLPPPAEAKKDGKDDNKPAPQQLQRKLEGWYFPKLTENRRSAYQALAARRLDHAREKIQDGKITEARQTLAPLAADGAGFEEQAQARQLLAELTGQPDAAAPAEHSSPDDPPADGAPAEPTPANNTE